MHARDLVELAATVVHEAGCLLRQGERISEQSLQAYWLASRLRQVRWDQHFRAYGMELQRTPPPAAQEAWRPLRPVLDEILLSEALTRVVAAVLSQRDHLSDPITAARPSSHHFRPVVHAVFLGHLEARHRALNLMTYGQGFSEAEGVMMNRLRRRCEHWCDLLLAGLVSQCDVSEYAVDFRRAQRLAAELGFQKTEVTRCPSWPWIRAALRVAFLPRSSSPPGPTCPISAGLGSPLFPLSPRSSESPQLSESPRHPEIPIYPEIPACPAVPFPPGAPALLASSPADLNQQIGAAVLSWLGGPVFDSWGSPHSPWITRLMETSGDARLVADEFLGDSSETPGSSGPRVPPRSRLDRPNSDSHPRRFG